MPDIVLIGDTDTKPKTKKPKMWMVILINDDFTPMDFVTELLISCFNKNTEDALILTTMIHTVGRAVIDTYTYEIAETKINMVAIMSRDNGYPLLATMEPMA